MSSGKRLDKMSIQLAATFSNVSTESIQTHVRDDNAPRHGPEAPHRCLPTGAASSPLPCAAPHCVPHTVESVMFGTASWNGRDITLVHREISRQAC